MKSFWALLELPGHPGLDLVINLIKSRHVILAAIGLEVLDPIYHRLIARG